MSPGRPDDPRPIDDAVDHAWRTASNEVPGSRIDATILDAARAEVNRDQRRPADAGGAAARRRLDRWTAWQPLAAAATVAGLAFVLVQTMPQDRDVAPPIAVEQARPEAEAPGPEMSGPRVDEAHDAGSAPAGAESRAADELRAPAVPVPAPRAADMTAAPVEAAADNTGAPPAAVSSESRDEHPLRSRAAVPAPAAAGVAAQVEREVGGAQRATKSSAFALTPEAWAARVEERFVAGDHAAAATELRAFRVAHADADRYLPDDLLDWAGTVK